MTPKEKYRAELDNMILKRKETIVEHATGEFLKNGIEKTTMADVAKASEVGVASLYRYFHSKTELVIQSAVQSWRIIEECMCPALLTNQYRSLNGIQQLETIGNLMIKNFDKFSERLIFINDFEFYIRREQISFEQLSQYESVLMRLKPYVIQVLNKGQADHTLRLNASAEDTYIVLSQLLISLVQKLAVYNNLLVDGNALYGPKSMESAMHMLIDWMRADPA